MVYYKYKKEKLEEKFLESKVFLVKIRECIKRIIIDMCETYLVSTDNYIPNKSGSEIIELASSFGFISAKDSKRLQAIIKLRNRYTHDYYQRKLSRERIIKMCRGDLATLELFLEISQEKIKLVINDGN